MKAKNIFFIFLLVFTTDLLFAQGENDNWYFGNKAAVNFSGSVPVSLSNSNMYTIEACGSVSDSNGNLLFYTDGINIWNSNHQVMPNGSGLGGHVSSQQLAILKHPGNINQYLVFNTGYNGYNVGANIISYSIVDITLQGGLGDVVTNLKNIPVTDNLGNNFQSEAITVVPASGNKFWLLMPKNQTLYSYLVDSQGFHNGTPVMSNLNFPTNLGTNVRHFGIKASQKLCNKSFSNYLCINLWFDNYNPAYQNKVYSFDNTSGQITNDYSLEVNSVRSYLPEFNKYGSVLFLGYDYLYAVDLESSTPSNVIFSQIYDFGTNTPCSALQRNKNNDIYISQSNSYYLGRIINPDVYNPANMSVDMQNLLLGNNMFGQRANNGLPQLIETARNADTQYCQPPVECLSDITLYSQETNTNYIHRAVIITTKDKYSVDASNGKITLRAGESVTMLPDTFIKEGSDFLAHIQDCKIKGKAEKNNKNRVELVLNLDKKSDNNINNDINIYPNPVTDILSIKSPSNIVAIEVYDISGKRVNVTLHDNKVDVRNLPSGNYIITIETKEGKTTKKFIKK